MTSPNPPFFAIVQRQFELLLEERAVHYAAIEQIDGKLKDAAKGLGINVEEFVSTPIDQPRLLPRTDKRSAGSMTAFTREFFRNTDKGVTRLELRNIIAAHDEKWAAMFRQNPNGFYNMVKRAIDRQEIVDIGGVLYPFARAPLPEGEEDPTGQHIESNVATLFGPHREGSGNA